MMRLNDVTNKESDHLEKPNLATNNRVFFNISSLLIFTITFMHKKSNTYMNLLYHIFGLD